MRHFTIYISWFWNGKVRVQSPSPLCRLHSCNKHPTPGMQIRNQSGLKVESISGFIFFSFGTICIITGITYFSILNLSFYEMVLNWFQWMLWWCVCQAANTLLLERVRKYKWHSYFCHYFCAIWVKKNIYIFDFFKIIDYKSCCNSTGSCFQLENCCMTSLFWSKHVSMWFLYSPRPLS